MTRTVVIVGYGMVGYRLVRRLRERDGAGTWRVVVLRAGEPRAEEGWPASDRVSPSSYVDGWDAAALTLPGAGFADDELITVRLGDPLGDPGTVRTVVERGYRLATDSVGSAVT
jgi:nitrite reductase (NADH) large subunit